MISIVGLFIIGSTIAFTLEIPSKQKRLGECLISLPDGGRLIKTILGVFVGSYVLLGLFLVFVSINTGGDWVSSRLVLQLVVIVGAIGFYSAAIKTMSNPGVYQGGIVWK